MAQYRRIKAELPKDALLLFRLGDFYEMFFEDAQIGAQLLNLSLTKRNQIPMCGLPFHAANNYITRILKAGRKVAICDQTEEARPGKLVERAVTAILSPGTHFDERLLLAERNNFLAAVVLRAHSHGLALVDLTTGDFRSTELPSSAALLAEIERLRPAEIIFPSEQNGLAELLNGSNAQRNPCEDWTFLPECAVPSLCEQFHVSTLDGFGLRDRPAAISAAGGILHYLKQVLRRDTAHLTHLSYYETSHYLVLDCVTLRNLEILDPIHSGTPRNHTLFGSINRTVTPMGARQLRDWITQPLAAVDPIRLRQSAVQTLLHPAAGLDAFRAALGEVRDLERTLSRLSLGSGNARDLVALRNALTQVPALQSSLQTILALPSDPPSFDLPTTASPTSSHADPQNLEGETAEFSNDNEPQNIAAGLESASLPLLELLRDQLNALPDLVQKLETAIVDEPPLALKEGGIIRDSFHPELDNLRSATRNGRDWIAKLQQDEVARTGIPSLKLGFNSVFGYYIEVTKTHLAKVPPEYIRKQTIANGERFITPALKEMEQKILGAEERASKLEYELFQILREEVLHDIQPIQQTARAIAQLDVLACFAEIARLQDWNRPEVGDSGILSLTDARHPVLERSLVEERFVPNDTELNLDECQIALITGPNMAGKSTYIRQVALVALLAHTGSFVPAKAARVDLIDRIFTRIGASDNLARGQSTFMVEMSETANILNNATRRSLVILDEIGRGTSTFDGLSLAWSIVEHLHHQVGAKTLFATHYHELAELAGTLGRVRNFHVVVKEWGDRIVFLHKVQEGGTDKSYGIQVARLAGVPSPVIERAKTILNVLEEAELNLKQVLDAGTHPDGATESPATDPQVSSSPSASSSGSASGSSSTRAKREREKLRQLQPSPQLDLFS